MYAIEESNQVLRIGKTGENEFRTFAFDVGPWLAVYPDGEIMGVYRRPDNTVYPVTICTSGNTATWTVTDTDLAVAGNGEIELQILCGALIGKSRRIACIVTESMDPGDTPPAPGMDWITETIRKTNEAAQAATDAKNELLAAAERGDFDGEPGAPGDLTQEQIADLINNCLAENPIDLPLMDTDTLGGAKLGENLILSEEGHLAVDTASAAEEDNTKPITSAAVHSIVGDIESLLESI